MKQIKILIFIIIIAFPKLMQGQFAQKYSLTTTTGYVSNIFKSPDSLAVKIDTVKEVQYKNDLWDNSAYQEFTASVKINNKWGKQEFSGKIEPELNYYFALPKKSYFNLRSFLNYKYNFKKKFRFESNLNYYYINRNGTNFDDVELPTPLGYQLLEANNGLHWRFSKQNRSSFAVFFENKNYAPSIKTHLLYNNIGAEFETKQSFYNNDLQNTIGFAIGYYDRFYKITENKYNAITAKRDWRYIEASVFYSYPISKIIKLTAGIDYQKRIDKTLTLDGYKMFNPMLALEFEGERYSIKSKFNYKDRLYSNRMGNVENVGDNEAPLMHYTYYLFASKGALQLTKKLYFITNIDFDIRKTNKENINSRSFRGYKTFDIGIGLKYDF
jgi:hypothetical protein